MVNETIIAARKEMRKVQMELGHKITPVMSIWIGQSWERALEKDPEGSQLKYVIEEIREMLG